MTKTASQPLESEAKPFTRLRFRCAATGKLVDYEVPGDAKTLKDLWSRSLWRSCRHCGRVHRFAFRSAYIDGILGASRWVAEQA